MGTPKKETPFAFPVSLTMVPCAHCTAFTLVSKIPKALGYEAAINFILLRVHNRYLKAMQSELASTEQCEWRFWFC